MTAKALASQRSPAHLPNIVCGVCTVGRGLCVLVQVLEEGDCKMLGMGLFLGVAQGSDEPLRFIHLTYTPEGPVTHKASALTVCRVQATASVCWCHSNEQRHLHAAVMFTARLTLAGAVGLVVFDCSMYVLVCWRVCAGCACWQGSDL